MSATACAAPGQLLGVVEHDGIGHTLFMISLNLLALYPLTFNMFLQAELLVQSPNAELELFHQVFKFEILPHFCGIFN